MRLALTLLTLLTSIGLLALGWLALRYSGGDEAPLTMAPELPVSVDGPGDAVVALDVRSAPELDQAAAPPDRERIEIEPLLEAPSAGDEVVRRWILSFGITSTVKDELKEVQLSPPDGPLLSARLDPKSGRFRADIVGARASLESKRFVVFSGRGRSARYLVILRGEGDAPDAVGDLGLSTSTWDLQTATIDAGVVALLTPPLLGRLILEPKGVGDVAFEITSDGTSGPLKTRVDFFYRTLLGNDGDTAELATFLPATEWTAKRISGETLRSIPDWTKTAPAGSDIVVNLTDARGVRISIHSSHVRALKRLVIVAMPSPARTRLTLAELDERTRAQGMPAISSRGGGGLRHLSAGQHVIDTGNYMVEAWGDENDAGELRLLTSASAVVRDTFVDVVLD